MDRSLNIYELEVDKTYYFIIQDTDKDDLGYYSVKNIFIVHYNGIIADYTTIGRFPFKHLVCLFSNAKPYKSFRTESRDDYDDTLPYYEIYNNNEGISSHSILSTNNSLKQFDESIGTPEHHFQYPEPVVFPPGVNPFNHFIIYDNTFDEIRANAAVPWRHLENQSHFCFHGKDYNPAIRTGQLFLIDLYTPFMEDIEMYRFFEKKSKSDSFKLNDIFRIKDTLERKISQAPAELAMSFLVPPKKLGGKRKTKRKTRKHRLV
jgi:hypothetical protein